MKTVKEIFAAAGYEIKSDQRNYYHRGLSRLLESGLVTFQVCERGKVWISGRKHNVRVFAAKRVMRSYVGSSVELSDVLRVCGKLLQDEQVKQHITAYVDVDSRCGRCKGQEIPGYIRMFSHVCDGICFECYGTGFSPKHRDVVEIIMKTHKNKRYMNRIFVTENYRPAQAYTDYAILYRKAKGTTKGCLTLLTFCKKMEAGKMVKVGNDWFIPFMQPKPIILK